MKKENLYGILSGVFCASLIISNILSFKTFTLWDFVLPTAVILFPIVYITNDILSEVFGYKKTKQVVITGFMMNIIAVVCYNIAIILPAPVYFTGQESFSLVLSNTLRVLIASMSAYIVGSLVNAKVMEKLKEKYEDKLMFRCVSSTLIGEGLDALIFIIIAFLGTMPVTSLLVMIVCQATFKTLYEVVCYPVTKKLITKAKEMK